MSRIGTIAKSALQLAKASSHTSGLQLALQRWQLCSASRVPFSAKANDGDGGKSLDFRVTNANGEHLCLKLARCTVGEAASGTDRGSWRSWVEQQLSGVSSC